MTNLQLIINLNPSIVKYNDYYYLVISNILGYDHNPGYALFISINDKIMTDDNDIQIFIHSLYNSTIEEISNILSEGIEDQFELGKDYFLSWSLWNYLMTYDNDTKLKLLASNSNDYRMPDYLDSQYNRINTDVYSYIEDTNLKYFYLENKLNEFEFTKEELNNFASTFCNIILENTTLTNITDVQNLIYKQVLEFYRNKGKDNTSIMLDLIFNNSTVLTPSGSSTGVCCTTTSNGESTTSSANTASALTSGNIIDTTTCKEKYEKAMFLYLINMLSNSDFYCDWMYIYGEGSSVSMPNYPLIKKLKALFENFKELGYNLSWGTSTSKCGCKELSSAVLKSQEVSNANYVIFDNYYKILEYTENQEICNNKNKVKVYGTAFANIFPYLYF